MNNNDNNGRQRFLTALNKEQPDKVPIFEVYIDEIMFIKIAQVLSNEEIHLKREQTGEVSNKDDILDLYCFIANELGLDAVSGYFSVGLKKIDEHYGVDKFGVKYEFSPHGEPIILEGPIKDYADLKNFSMSSQLSLDDCTDTTYLMDKLGDSKAHVLDVFDPFKMSWYLRGGMQNLLIDYMVNPKLVHDLAKVGTEYIIASVEFAANLGVDAILMVGDLAGEITTIMSPEHFREFIQPYEKIIVDFAHTKGLKVIKHSDGNLWPIMDDLIEVGFDGMHPFQPQCMDIAEVKKLYADKVCIFGNIDCRDLLCSEPEDEVKRVVKETIDIAGKDGGYIITSSNSIHPGVKPENYIAMVAAAHTYGRY
jgi:uroporphyrinogen decarboxylase